MGREQDLLEAARSGNVALIEKILSPRKKLTVGSLPLSLGPLASLRRAPNTNCHDQNGDTPLHLAALNGHLEAVKVLLKYEASTNIMDNKGCYPLHLAAWSGNADMCNVLLTHGPSLARINEQNLSGETALHCAAQYGHTATIAVLLPHQADPFLRNNHSESPLDLASQYGRLDSVELLVRKHPALLNSDADEDVVDGPTQVNNGDLPTSSKASTSSSTTRETPTHSPLHLAARNGHRHVVQLLLDSGFDVNRLTDSGTALHEAATYGKQDVVRVLLKKGINANLTDSSSRTAIDVLSEHKSQLSLDTGRIILDYLEGRSISDKRSSTQSNSSDLLDPHNEHRLSGLDHVHSAGVGVEIRHSSEPIPVVGSAPDRHRLSARSSGDSSLFGSASAGNRSSYTSESQGVYDVPKTRYVAPGLEEVDSASDTSGSPLSVAGGLSLSSASHPLSLGSHGSNSPASTRSSQLVTHGGATPDTPKKPPRRKAQHSVLTSVASSTLTSATPAPSSSLSRASPPRMVFITKRTSAASRDSASSSDGSTETTKPEVVTMTTSITHSIAGNNDVLTVDNNNGSVNVSNNGSVSGRNNNIDDMMRTSMTSSMVETYDNVPATFQGNNVLMQTTEKTDSVGRESSALNQGDVIMQPADADVANSNHQRASLVAIATSMTVSQSDVPSGGAQDVRSDNNNSDIPDGNSSLACDETEERTKKVASAVDNRQYSGNNRLTPPPPGGSTDVAVALAVVRPTSIESNASSCRTSGESIGQGVLMSDVVT